MLGYIDADAKDGSKLSHERKRAVISENTAANNELVAAVSGKKICVLEALIIAIGLNTITLKSATTAVTGPVTVGATGGFRIGPAPWPGDHAIETAAGEALNMTQSAATRVSGYVVYYEL